MEAFTLLRYWCTTAGGTGTPTATAFFTGDSVFNARRIPAADTTYSGYGFDGPYFDLDFTIAGDSTESESEDLLDELQYSEFENRIIKSVNEFRFLLLNLRKSKLGENDEKVVRVKGPLVDLFAIDESNNCEEFKHKLRDSEKKLGKEMLQKYLSILKPLHVRGSSGVEKMKLSGEDHGRVYTPGVAAAGRRSVKSLNSLQAGLKLVSKHLGKSRSTSGVSPPGKMGLDRREVEDGIQGAILHCKR